MKKGKQTGITFLAGAIVGFLFSDKFARLIRNVVFIVGGYLVFKYRKDIFG